MSKQLKQGETMEAVVASPTSPRNDDHNGWTLVERPLVESVTEAIDLRPRAARPIPEPAEALGEHEEQDGMKSPESERLADDVLREPFQAGGPLQLQLAAPAHAPTVEEPATPTAASGPHTGSCGDLSCPHFHAHDLEHVIPFCDHAALTSGGAGAGCGSGGIAAGWSFDRHHHERLRAASRLSGEGALEGFQDPQDLLFADSAAPGAAARVGCDVAADVSTDDESGGAIYSSSGAVYLGWDALLTNVWGDLLRELEDVKALVTITASALWGRVQEGRMAVEDWATAVRESAHKTAKSMGRPGCPLWTLIGISGLAAVALAALAAQVVLNRRLTSQLRQRDKDLARLVVKILNLQDALQSASRAVPVLRQASLERFTTTTLIGMV
ncbi:hypothetical protein Vretimale_12940 [Volvox reticuliferus]|uniref:Uncharacterized protein n=1 Tax=Volvox reticuliferus TaxID=1737510 RepID=A0A8J4GKN1_9CHLO|nr:hypothetical protein Vretifemale_9287 [Volvox reticuliferus]GIM09062.1 hypothetical protein Vretimale_12940 [Volvox reticuliferus]